MSESKKTIARILCVVFTITLMVGLSELVGDREIVFPEIAAMSVGCLLAPHKVWQLSSPRMVITIVICAVCGIGIVLYMPVPHWVQITFAYLIGQMVLCFSGTSFAPMISAIALPVLLGTREPMYILYATCLTTLVAVLRIMLEGVKVLHKDSFTVQHNDSRTKYYLLYRTICAMVLALVVLRFNWRFCIAPPMLVGFTEICNVKVKNKRRLQVVLMIALCALIGAGFRYGLCNILGLHLFVAVFFASVVGCVIIAKTKLFIPPAAAMIVLAFLISKDDVLVYPLQATVGAIMLALMSVIVAKLVGLKKVD